MSFSWLPLSIIFPWSRTIITSEFLTVERRCAITNTVRDSIISEGENVLIRQAVAEHFGITVGDAEKIATFGSLEAYEQEAQELGEKLAIQEVLFTAAVDRLIDN